MNNNILHIKIFCIFVMLTVQTYAIQNINIKKSGMEFYSFLGLDCKHHTCNNNMEKICGIYKITSPTKSIYIGQSKDIKNRWKKYKYGLRGQPKLYNSIKKYGYENHNFEIVELCSESELNDREIYYINMFQSFNTEHGLNLTSGGLNYILSDSSKKTRSEQAKNRPLPLGFTRKGSKWTDEQRIYMITALKGRRLSKEACLKMSEKRKGIKRNPEIFKKAVETRRINGSYIVSEESRIKMKNSHIGKSQSPETIEKKRLYMIGNNIMLGRKLSQETKQKMSKSRLGKHCTIQHRIKTSLSLLKPIFQYSLEHKFIKRWDGIKLAGMELSINRTHISDVCRNKRKSAGGFIWKYA